MIRILIVEDEEPIANLIRINLKNAGQIVNEELQKMYDDLLLPQKVSIHSISQRSFMELYTLSDAAFMEEAVLDQLRNIYL